MKLAAITRKLTGRSDEQLEQEIAELRQERRRFARAADVFTEDAHAAADRLTEDARTRFVAEIQSRRHQLPAIEHPDLGRLVLLFVASSPEFEAALREAIDTAPAGLFASGTRAEHEAKLARYDEQVRDFERELERRRIARQRDEAEAELRELEAKS